MVITKKIQVETNGSGEVVDITPQAAGRLPDNR
jgi:hypothetical protein